MPEYVLRTHNIAPQEVFSKLESIDGVTVRDTEEIGDVGLAIIRSGMPIKDIYEQIGYSRLEVTISPNLRQYRTFEK